MITHCNSQTLAGLISIGLVVVSFAACDSSGSQGSSSSGSSSGDKTLQTSAPSAEATGPEPLVGIYEVTSYRKADSSCDAAKAQKKKAPVKYFFFELNEKSKEWGGWGCRDFASCKKDAKKFRDSGSRSGRTDQDVGTYSTQDGARLSKVRPKNWHVSGAVTDGICRVKYDDFSARHDKTKNTLHIEGRMMFMDDFPVKERHDCIYVKGGADNDAKLSCKTLAVWEAKRVADAK